MATLKAQLPCTTCTAQCIKHFPFDTAALDDTPKSCNGAPQAPVNASLHAH